MGKTGLRLLCLTAWRLLGRGFQAFVEGPTITRGLQFIPLLLQLVEPVADFFLHLAALLLDSAKLFTGLGDSLFQVLPRLRTAQFTRHGDRAAPTGDPIQRARPARSDCGAVQQSLHVRPDLGGKLLQVVVGGLPLLVALGDDDLGRLVSVRDYETEMLSIPGVVTAAAAWDLYAGVPALILRVLLASGREAEFAAVRDTIAHAQRCRGPDRFSLVVQQARPRFLFADLTYARDPSFVRADVEAALRAALGLFDDTANERSGLFGLHARRLGEPEYASRIEGRAQDVPGVLWCKITGLGRFSAGATDPATLVTPAMPRPVAAKVACAPLELLQLASQHLTLMPADERTVGECA